MLILCTALSFEDSLEYQARQTMIDDLISLERVKGRMQTIFLRRAFLAHRVKKGTVEAPGTWQAADCMLGCCATLSLTHASHTSVPQIILEESLSDRAIHSVAHGTSKPDLSVHTGSVDYDVTDTGSGVPSDGGLLKPYTREAR